MRTSRALPFLVLAAAIGACEGGNRQNSALCGLTMMASANRVLDQMANAHAVLSEAPEELTAGSIPTRVVGYAPAVSMAGMTQDSGVVLGYGGEGLPAFPGFGLALVDDSSEAFRGVIVFESEPPPFPRLGSIVSSVSTVPLFALRIHWTSVNSEECPLFFVPDTSGT